MWNDLAADLGATTRRDRMPDGLPVQIVFGDLEWAEFDLISADGHTMLRCFREPGLPDGQIRKHLFEDEQLQAAYLGAFGQPLQPNAVEVQDHVTIHGGDPASADGLAALIRRTDTLAAGADACPRVCWHCATHEAELFWADGAVGRACDACKTLLEGWRDRMQRVADQQPDTQAGEVFPPLPLPGDLTPTKLRQMSAELDTQFQANPDSYRMKMLGWVAMGQGAMLGGALLLLAVVLASVGLVVGITYLGVGILVMKLLFTGKMLKFVLLALVGAGALFGRFAGSITGIFSTNQYTLDELPGTEVSRSQAPELYRWLDDLAAEVGAPRVDRVLVDTRLNAFASERRVGRFRHERIVGIGLPLLDVLEPDEAKAVLAHELGHLRNQDSRTAWIYRAAHDWIELGWKLAENQMGAMRFAMWYVPRFLIRAKVVAREHERQADTAAAAATSPDAIARALVKINVIASCADDALQRGVRQRAFDESDAPPTMGPLIRSGLSRLKPATLIRVRREAFDAQPHWLDAHPSLRERVAHVGVDADVAVDFDGAGATELIPGLQGLREPLQKGHAEWLAVQIEMARLNDRRTKAKLAWLKTREATAEPDPRRHHALAQLLGQRDETHHAVAECRTAVALRPDEAALKLQLLRYCLVDEDPNAALDTARPLVADPDAALDVLMGVRSAFERAGAHRDEHEVIQRIKSHDLPDFVHGYLDERLLALGRAQAG